MKFTRGWLWLLLFVPIALGATRLRFDVEVLNLLPSDLPLVKGLKIYQQNFSNARELILTIEAPSAQDAEQTARTLATSLRRQTNLVEYVSWTPAWMEHPDQAAELIAYLWLNQPPEIIQDLTNRLGGPNLTNTLLEARESLATSLSPGDIAFRGYDPFRLTVLPPSVSAGAPSLGDGEELFASPDGTFRVVFVEARSALVNYKQCRAWLNQIKAIIRAEQDAGNLSVTIQFTGRPVFVTEIAGGMERDMTTSAGGTLLIIGILFYLTHRRSRPLVLLLAILTLLLVATTAFGGFFFGVINVVSLGFACILAGLAEDFGVILYQESRSHPELSELALRRAAGPGIFWSAVTTAGAFLMLNFGGLPGLAQLGSLVAIGVLLAAVVMVYAYLPLLLRFRRPHDLKATNSAEKLLLFRPVKLLPPWSIWSITGILLIACGILLSSRGLHFDRSPDPLKPRNSEAYATVERIKTKLGRTEEPAWVLVPGRTEQEVEQKLDAVRPWLESSVSNRLISSFTLPQALWPRVSNHIANRSALAGLVEREDALRAAALAHGFAPQSLRITKAIIDHWRNALTVTNVYWPSNDASRWVLDKFVARPDGQFLAIGLAFPTPSGSKTKAFLASLPPELQRDEVLISSWSFLGPVVFEAIVESLPRVLIPILALVLISLWLAFRNVKDVALSLATLGFSSLCLIGAMALFGWKWNLLNIMAAPLLLGMGVDYSIHIQLALRRYQGDLMAVRRSVGRALLLAGATTVVGFGSLAFSTNLGMASLGKICALGVGLALLTGVYLLPVWWNAFSNRPG